jgi:cell division transport system permease protein
MTLLERFRDVPGPILPPRRGAGLLYVQVALFAFIAALALGTFIILEKNTYSGSLTVQIMPDGDAPPPEEVAAALSLLRATPGIIFARVMSNEENQALVSPWLPPNSAVETLPFPALIDVKFGPRAKPDIGALKSRLLASAPHAVIDDHSEHVARTGLATDRTPWIAAIILGISFCAFILSFASATRAQIWGQHDALDLLQLLGATNRRVAGIFAGPPSLAALLAALPGTALATAAMLLAAAPQKFGLRAVPLLPPVLAADLAPLAIIPVATAIIAWMTARLLVHSALRSY